jgi:hypothetical protein
VAVFQVVVGQPTVLGAEEQRYLVVLQQREQICYHLPGRILDSPFSTLPGGGSDNV